MKQFFKIAEFKSYVLVNGVFILLSFGLFFNSAQARTLEEPLSASAINQVSSCGNRATIGKSITYSDGQYDPLMEFLFEVQAIGQIPMSGGRFGMHGDDVAFIYTNTDNGGNVVRLIAGLNGIPTPSDVFNPVGLPCNTPSSGDTELGSPIYFLDGFPEYGSIPGIEETVTVGGVAYDTHMTVGATNSVGFSGINLRVIWDRCTSGQKVENGACVDITGTLTASPSTCTAPCNVTLNFTSNSTSVISIYSGARQLDYPGPSGSLSDPNLSAGIYDYCMTGRDGTGNEVGVTDQNDSTITPVCTTVTVNSSVNSSPSGTLSVSPASCIIASGASSCNVNLTWTTANLAPGAIPAVTRSNPTITVSTATSGTNVSSSINYGSSAFYLYSNTSNGVQIAPSVNVTATCTSGTAWNGSTCALNVSAPTATLQVRKSSTISPNPNPWLSDITVAPGNKVDYKWSSTNSTFQSTNLGIVNLNVNPPSGSSVNSDPCGNSVSPPFPIYFGSGGEIDNNSVYSCQSGYTYTWLWTASNQTASAQAIAIVRVVAPALSAKWTENNSPTLTKTVTPGQSIIPFNYWNSGASGSVLNVTGCYPTVISGNIPYQNITVTNCSGTLTAP